MLEFYYNWALVPVTRTILPPAQVHQRNLEEKKHISGVFFIKRAVSFNPALPQHGISNDSFSTINFSKHLTFKEPLLKHSKKVMETPINHS